MDLCSLPRRYSFTRGAVIRLTSDITTTRALALRYSFIRASVLPSRGSTSAFSPNSPPPASPSPRPIRAPNDELRKRILEHRVSTCAPIRLHASYKSFSA
ncbi:hypothetical protein C8R45DRAFT_1110660 [Mycena sanguinolenta]|nr:hypothetical protein C8R45DRAFT_1110660 [Mycena sanguinolenta]